MDDWHDPAFVRRWDAAADRGNPVRREHLDILMACLREVCRPGDAVLDLGSGSALVASRVLEELPRTRVVGIEPSQPMRAMADERMRRLGLDLVQVAGDLRSPDAIALPADKAQHRFAVAIAVQTLHTLDPDHQRAAIAWVARHLAPGGWFLISDRVAVTDPPLFPAFRAAWDRWAAVYGTTDPVPADLAAHHRLEREKGDRPLSLADLLAALRGAGFAAQPLHVHANRALVAGHLPSGNDHHPR